MAVKSLSKYEFDRRQPARDPMAAQFAEERDWYTDDEGNLLGVLLWDRVDRDWAFVILGRDERGRFRAIETDVSIPDEATARSLLTTAMDKIASRGQAVFPQGD
jgi:hypothetical protein